MMVGIVIALLALLLLGSALALLARAQAQEKNEGLKLRLRVEGASDDIVPTASIASIRNPVVRWVCRLFWRTGSEIEPKTVVQAFVALLMVAVVLAIAINPFVAAAAVGLFLVLTYMVQSQRASRRRVKIIEQLPSFLENVIRVLAAGNTFEESLVQAARESQDPIRPLFVSIGRQVRLGATLDGVLAEAGDIYRIRDLKVMSLATSINRKYGGSMRSVLKSLIVAIRQRGTAAKELRALTAETRFSAFVLAGLTIFLFLFLFFSNRNYYDSMLATTGGTIMLGVSGGLVFLGFFVLWRMIKSIDEAD